MVTNSVFITAVISLAAVSISGMTLVVKVLGDRIADVGMRVTGLDARVTGFESRVDTRMNALEGAVRDVGERLTVLEADLGKR